jgi:hypothetical protein
LGNNGRNLLHNGLFNVVQRGNGAWTTNGAYTADRWRISYALDTVSFVAAQFGIPSLVGDEAITRGISNTFTGNAGAGAYTALAQPIESVARLANKTVTLSFYAAANSGTPKLGASLDQGFGTGGSPSATVNNNGQSVTLSTSWQRYSLTFTLASLSGKTLGTNGDDYTILYFWYSSGSSFAARSGNVGVQSGLIYITGVQLEIGSVATQLEKIEYADDLRHCQRFFYIGQIAYYGYGVAAVAIAQTFALPTQMRAGPTVTITSNNSGNVTSPGGFSLYAGGLLYFSGTITATGSFTLNVNFTASADL